MKEVTILGKICAKLADSIGNGARNSACINALKLMHADKGGRKYNRAYRKGLFGQKK